MAIILCRDEDYFIQNITAAKVLFCIVRMTKGKTPTEVHEQPFQFVFVLLGKRKDKAK